MSLTLTNTARPSGTAWARTQKNRISAWVRSEPRLV
jgi:hypothetical protein